MQLQHFLDAPIGMGRPADVREEGDTVIVPLMEADDPGSGDVEFPAPTVGVDP